MSFSTPIDFPSPANDGEQYTFEGITYTYDKSAGLPGYWKIISPGQIGPASEAEINLPIVDDQEDGTDLRYITPKGLHESKYLDGIQLQVDGGTPWYVMKGNPIEILRTVNTGSSKNGLKITRVDNGIDFNMEYAGVNKTGAVQLATSYLSEGESQAATLKAVKGAARQGYESAYCRHNHTGNNDGWFKIKDRYNNNNGLVIAWGYHQLTNAEKTAKKGKTFFVTGINYSDAPYYVGMVPWNQSINKEYSLSIGAKATNRFEWYHGSTTMNGFHWFSIGRGTALSSGTAAYQVDDPYGK